jgi:hypothetical protein
MNLDDAIKELRSRNRPTPKCFPLPARTDVAAMEVALGVQFHPDYVRLLLEASDVSVGPLEPATIMAPASHTYLPEVVASARHYGVPESLFPICEDNADFYCLTAEGSVVFWSHNGWDPSAWPNLASWIADVWLADYS